MGGMISIPFLLCPKLCIEVDDVARAYIFSTLFFICGIVTFLQTTFGIRSEFFTTTYIHYIKFTINYDIKNAKFFNLTKISDYLQYKEEHFHSQSQHLQYWHCQKINVRLILMKSMVGLIISIKVKKNMSGKDGCLKFKVQLLWPPLVKLSQVIILMNKKILKQNFREIVQHCLKKI